MRKSIKFIFTIFITICLFASTLNVKIYAIDEAVQEVITQLENIDTLQEMQDKKYNFSVKNSHYDTGTTNQTVIDEHEKARSEYETYLSNMFAARLAAQNAYDALTNEQKAQIDSTLVEKLDNTLLNTFRNVTLGITPSTNEYTFKAIEDGAGYGYEVSNYMVSGNIPQTFILVDTADGKTSWSPNGLYEYGKSNYEVTYCCDVETPLAYGTNYKRVNLEDSYYYGESAAKHIRAILQNSYPYLTMDEVKANLKKDGMNEEFVDSLTRSDMISATQMAVWAYANSETLKEESLGYFASINITKNIGTYFTPLHDHSNEVWEWLPGKSQRSYDARAEYRVNNLAYYLCNLEGVEANDDQIIISEVKVTRADLISRDDDTYNVGMYVYLNNGGKENDNLVVTVTSYHVNEDGTKTITSKNNQLVKGRTKLGITVNACSNDLIEVVVEGTQTVEKGVYFYEPEGGRDVSQSLVGISEGKTRVKAVETFEFVEDMGANGIRIYKTDATTGYPLSDITFDIYSVDETDTISDKPTDEEIEKYKVEENKITSITTDSTGYTHETLEIGTYLIVEQENTKVKSPVDPFYITIPMSQTKQYEDGTTFVEVLDIISIYPKNETVDEPEEPPVVPPTPDKVTGQFSIIKVDAEDNTVVLEGAQFKLYKPAVSTDTNIEIIQYQGVEYAVVPVVVDETEVILTTNELGEAYSPELACGSYFLVETIAPNGYNLLKEPVLITVLSSEVSDTQVFEIENTRGAVLPNTGGEGTMKIVMIFGGLLTILTFILLITKKLMNLSDTYDDIY